MAGCAMFCTAKTPSTKTWFIFVQKLWHDIFFDLIHSMIIILANPGYNSAVGKQSIKRLILAVSSMIH
jgi:hypothetical protein